MTFPSTITITTAIKYLKDDRSILTGDRSKICSRNNVFDDNDDNADDGDSFISFQTAGGPIDLDLLYDLNEVFSRVRIDMNTTTTCIANTDINDTATIIPYPSIFLGRGNNRPVDLDDSDFENDSTTSRSINDEESSVRSLKTGTSITTSATSLTTITTTNTGDTNNSTEATTLLRCRRGRNSGPIDLDESDFDDSTIGSTNFDDEESVVNLNKKTVVGPFYTDITSTTTAMTAVTTTPISSNSGTHHNSIVTTPLKGRCGRDSGPIDLDDSVFDDSTIGSNFDTESKAISILSLQTTAGSGLIDMDWIQDLDESFSTIWNQHEDEFLAWKKSYSKEEEIIIEDRNNNNKFYYRYLPETTILSLTTKTTTEGNSDDDDDENDIADDEDDMVSVVSVSCRSLDTFGYPNG